MNNGAVDSRNTNEKPTGVSIDTDNFEDISSFGQPNSVNQEGGTKSGGGTSSDDWTSRKGLGGGDNYGIQYVPSLLAHLEEKLPFTTMLVSLVGYIIISAFGQMSSLKRYLGYLGFLVLVYAFYKAQLPTTKIAFSAITKKINSFFIVGFFTLLAVLVIAVVFNWGSLLSFLHPTSKKIAPVTSVLNTDTGLSSSSTVTSTFR